MNPQSKAETLLGRLENTLFLKKSGVNDPNFSEIYRIGVLKIRIQTL
jgi:hypothetical protein